MAILMKGSYFYLIFYVVLQYLQNYYYYCYLSLLYRLFNNFQELHSTQMHYYQQLQNHVTKLIYYLIIWALLEDYIAVINSRLSVAIQANHYYFGVLYATNQVHLVFIVQISLHY